MAIKKYFVNNPLGVHLYDRRAGKWYSWGYDVYLNGTRQQERGFVSRDSVERIVAKLKEDAKKIKHGIEITTESPFLIELFQKKLEIMTTTPKDRVRAKTIFKRFLEIAPANIRVTELRQAHIQQYISTRLGEKNQSTGEPLAPQTIDRELAPIVAALNAASKFFPELDDYRPPKIPRPKVPRGRKERVISQAEQKAIFKYLFADRKDGEDRRMYENRIRTGQFLQFCLLTLSRPGEAAAVKCSDVNFEAGTVTIIGTKTRFTADRIIRELKLTPTLHSILSERLKLTQGDFVFTTGGVVTPKMYEQMKLACELNKIRYGRNDKFAVSFHTTRHTGITRLLQRGVDLKTIGKLSGHSDARMTMYYSHSNTTLTDAASDILEHELT